MVKQKTKYHLGRMYKLNFDFVYLGSINSIAKDNKGDNFKAGEHFILVPNKDKKIGPVFLSLKDGALIAESVAIKVGGQMKKPMFVEI